MCLPVGDTKVDFKFVGSDQPWRHNVVCAVGHQRHLLRPADFVVVSDASVVVRRASIVSVTGNHAFGPRPLTAVGLAVGTGASRLRVGAREGVVAVEKCACVSMMDGEGKR